MDQVRTPAPSRRAFTRGSKACRRCRRLRTKCENQGGVPPCDSCRLASEDCVFLRRGVPDVDRAHRQSRARASPARSEELAGPSTASTRWTSQVIGSSSSVSALDAARATRPSSAEPLSLTPRASPPNSTTGWDLLPPYDEVVEGIQTLTTSYFQLGFIPKALFFEQLKNRRESVSVFLLLCILSISARFTPSLVRRYHGGSNATQAFLGHAAALVPEQMFTPSLESIQGLFLLSIAEWGNAEKPKSLIYMGIAVRLAGILRLHREETYRLPDSATREEVVHSEVARRTFWMLETFENLHSGADSPVTFSYRDITVLLPCDERDFTFGVQPLERAALAGTPPAVRCPDLARLPSRSLFATLLQTHSLWGQVARQVSAENAAQHQQQQQQQQQHQPGSGSEPSLSAGDYGRLARALQGFEDELPAQHRWSLWNLRGHKTECLDLAYLSVVMVLRLSNIILRRSYVHEMLLPVPPRPQRPQQQRRQGESMTIPMPMPMAMPMTDSGAPLPATTTATTTTGEVGGTTSSSSSSGAAAVAQQLFDNVVVLHEQISAFVELRAPDQGFPALIVFCVYVCGSLANHLRRRPSLCPRVAPRAARILRESTATLGDLQDAWGPLARRWHQALCRSSVADDDVDNAAGGDGPSTAEDVAAAAPQGAAAVVDVPPPMAPQTGYDRSTSCVSQEHGSHLDDWMFGDFDFHLWSNIMGLGEAATFSEPAVFPTWGST
ncbi:hypothetical protein GGR56DRAFT_313956 [Xylariaceae sp. FL0804]|nr:hypothetical protein GGR56DRAFT_313956 [Xylariaceae sp. FL0804]